MNAFFFRGGGGGDGYIAWKSMPSRNVAVSTHVRDSRLVTRVAQCFFPKTHRVSKLIL